MINLKEIKPRHHLQLLKTFPKTTPKQSRRRTFNVSINLKIEFKVTKPCALSNEAKECYFV